MGKPKLGSYYYLGTARGAFRGKEITVMQLSTLTAVYVYRVPKIKIPIKNNRNLVATTIKAMERVEEIRQQRIYQEKLGRQASKNRKKSEKQKGGRQDLWRGKTTYSRQDAGTENEMDVD
jgi:hypothetical protein